MEHLEITEIYCILIEIRNEFFDLIDQGWISDMGIDGPTFVPKSGYFLPILVKVCPQKLAFS